MFELKWKTKITEMLGCKYPIILGAFAGYDGSDLVGAVSKAGGFGVLTASYFHSDDQFRNALLKIKKITRNPFGVNFSIDKEVTPDHPFYRFLKIAEEEGIKTITTAASKMEAFGKKAHEYKMIWIHKTTTMQHALNGVRSGANAIILTGLEGGGLKNPKQNTLFINSVNALRLLSEPFEVPYIASGGISTGRGMLAALILGAQAVHLCTAFLATKESPISNDWKDQLINTDCFDPKIINQVCHFDSDRPKYIHFSMAVGMLKQIIPAGELINNIVNEAESLLKKLGFQGDTIDFSQ